MSKQMRWTAKEVRDMQANAHGPKAAAWMVRQKIAQFRKIGWVDYTMPFGVKKPQWFELAIRCLVLRSKRSNAQWFVQESSTPDGLNWRVYWLGHPNNEFARRRAAMRAMS